MLRAVSLTASALAVALLGACAVERDANSVAPAAASSVATAAAPAALPDWSGVWVLFRGQEAGRDATGANAINLTKI
jgi:ribosomal protein S11